MEPLFENHYIWTKKMLREMYYRAYRPFLIVFGAIVVLSVLSLAVDLLFSETPLDPIPPLTLVVIVLAAAYLFLPLITAVATYNRMKKLYGSVPEVTIRFFEDHFVNITRQTGAVLNLEYAQIKKVLETKSLLLLKLSGQVFILLGKDCFTKGSAASLRVFLHGKMKKR